MGRTERFRKDHADLVSIVGEISRQLSPEFLARDASPARSLLAKLAGQLTVHLSVEDKSLYPSLRESPDPRVRQLADAFTREMGGIRAAFEGYMKKWPTAASIQANPAAFISETRTVFAVLAKRIERENKELYAAADAAA